MHYSSSSSAGVVCPDVAYGGMSPTSSHLLVPRAAAGKFFEVLGQNLKKAFMCGLKPIKRHIVWLHVYKSLCVCVFVCICYPTMPQSNKFNVLTLCVCGRL